MDVDSFDDSVLDESFTKLLLDSDEDEINDESQVDALILQNVSDSDSDDSILSTTSTDSWTSDCEAHNPWPFNEQAGPAAAVYLCEKPIEFYELFLSKAMLDLIVVETNRQAKAKFNSFVETTTQEVKKFIGLCLQMGVVKLPNLRDYWSTRPALGAHSIASKVMPRKRFEQLMSSLHFADNNHPDGNRLFKINEFLRIFNASCESIYRPEKDITIDESLVPFRGRIVFRQYIPSKKHKYGIKLFKLCCNGGYTWRVKVYAGKQLSRDGPVADSVVLELLEGLLDSGRQLCVDNWYTSVGLAKKLLKRRTNMIGTMRKNRKCIPKKVKEIKLKRGQIKAQQNRKGILVLKWKDKRDLLMLSTIHDGSIGQSNKPEVVEHYNKLMGFVDQSDQMASYTPFVRKTTKWYLRIFFHVMTQTAVVNSWKLYNDTQEKIKLNEFKLLLIESLLEDNLHSPPKISHKLEEVNGSKATIRKRCAGCYQKLSREQGRSYASGHSRKVSTRCSKCFTHYCIECFQMLHKKCIAN